MQEPRPRVLLADIAFSPRIMNVFRNHNLVYLDDLTQKTRRELRRMRNKSRGGTGLNRISLTEIVQTLDMYGRSLKPEKRTRRSRHLATAAK
jgi:DNA-directed RNA polymerase alpha subunit